MQREWLRQQGFSRQLEWGDLPFCPRPLCAMTDATHPTPPHPESSHRWSQAAPGPFRAWGARGSGVSRGSHLTQLSLVALGTLQREERQAVTRPLVGGGGEGEGHGWNMAEGDGGILPWPRSGPSRLASLVFLQDPEGEGGKGRKR